VAEQQPKRKRQIGPRVDDDLIKEVRILGIRHSRLLEDLVDEALRDLLKKYHAKKGPPTEGEVRGSSWRKKNRA
jgi:hypothetical protein